MITEEAYKKYFDVSIAPSNFSRLENIALQELRAIMIMNAPTIDEEYIYKEFLRALMEQMNYFDVNSELIDESSSSGYTLGSFSEGSSNNKENVSKSITRISPISYDILLNCGLLNNSL